MTPTRSEVSQWSTEGLEAAASHWFNVSYRWTDGFDALHRDSYTPGGTEYYGQGADGLREHTARARLKAHGASQELFDVANAATDGVEEINQAKTELLYAVEEAEANGYQVGEDWSVSGQGDVAGYQFAINSRLGTLVATDDEVAGRLKSRITAMDFKESPAPPPPDPVDQFYRHLSGQLPDPPCVGDPPALPSNWDKITTPGPGYTDQDLRNAWLAYVGSTFGSTWAIVKNPSLLTGMGMLPIVGAYDNLLKTYGMG